MVSGFIFVYELFSGLNLNLLPPFLPLFMYKSGFDTSWTGLILLAPSIGTIITITYITNIMQNFKTRKLFFYNTLLTVVLFII